MANIAQQLHQQMGVEDALFRKRVQGGNWDELANGFENNLQQQIAESANLTKLAVDTVTEAGTGNAEFFTLANGNMRDLKNFADRYAGLVRRRDGRTGPTKSSEEYTDYMSIGLELTSLSEELQVVVGATLFNLTESHNHALEVLREREEQKIASEQSAESPIEASPEATE